jgi:TolA-binding protein
VKKSLVLATVLSSILYGEVSVFGAGNLELENPYGLTQSEKVILDNKSRIKELKRDKYRFNNDLKSLQESVDALRELVDSVSKKNHEYRLHINSILKDIEQVNTLSEMEKEEDKKRYSEFKNIQSKSKEEINRELQKNFQKINKFINKENKQMEKFQKGLDKTLKSVQSEINSLRKDVAKINQQYVTQKQLDFVVEEFNKFKESLLKEFETMLNGGAKEEYDFSKHSNSENFKEGKRLVSIGKYKEAIKFFSYLIDRHYRPATDHYYIGESYYFSGDYKSAIKHYKESVSIYDQSKFMPNLLLHTGSSFQKLGDNRNAKTFYEILANKYSETVEGNKAKKILLKLDEKVN